MILEITSPMWIEIGNGVLETLYMTLVSTTIAYILGIPLGVILNITSPTGIKQNKVVYTILGFVINVLRSLPFVILAIWLIPFTRLVVGTSIGSNAMIVPLSICAAPFIARMVESSLKEVDAGKIEAAQAMGSSDFTIIRKVLIPEALPSLIVGAAIAIATILGYTAMAGFIAGGGLGDIAIRYGYHRYQDDVMLVSIIILVALVQIFQEVGMFVAKKIDKRLKNN